MSKYAVTTGIQNAPVKTVLYGPEGIGKSTFASHFPDPVFIDTEGGTKRLNVKRLPQPTSWAMLLDEVAEVRKGSVPCGTLVIDTADWAERLCIQAVCAKAKVNGIEDFGYGKGYTYVKEEFGKQLSCLHAGAVLYIYLLYRAAHSECEADVLCRFYFSGILQAGLPAGGDNRICFYGLVFSRVFSSVATG